MNRKSKTGGAKMTEKKVEISKEVLNFLTGIYYKDNEDEKLRKKRIFDRAFDMAYKDMATHTVAYHKNSEEYKKYIEGDNARTKRNKEKIRNTVKKHIKSSFVEENYSLSKRLFDNDFDEWHEEVCNSIVNIGNCDIDGLEAKDKTENAAKISTILRHIDKEIPGVFTYGQAQKLVNMMLKYLYIYYQCEGWNDLEKIVSSFHVPIDSLVLKAIFSGKDKYNEKTWSKFDDYKNDYLSCQRDIEEFVKDKMNYPSAFVWELIEWPFN